MSAPAIPERVVAMVCEQLGCTPERVCDATEFVQDLGADSLDLVELTIDVEDEFQIVIDDHDARHLTSVGALIQYVTAKCA